MNRGHYLQLRLPLLFKSSSRGRLCVFVVAVLFMCIGLSLLNVCRVYVLLLEVRRGYLIPGAGVTGACKVLDMGARN